MIKLNKDQIKVLRELTEQYDETPLHKCVVVVRVRELRYLTVETAEGFKQVLLPEKDDHLSGRERNGYYPFQAGCVMAVGSEANPGIKRGDIVRFSPLSGEMFENADGKISYLNCQDVEIKIVSGNIFEYEGEEVQSE